MGEREGLPVLIAITNASNDSSVSVVTAKPRQNFTELAGIKYAAEASVY